MELLKASILLVTPIIFIITFIITSIGQRHNHDTLPLKVFASCAISMGISVIFIFIATLISTSWPILSTITHSIVEAYSEAIRTVINVF